MNELKGYLKGIMRTIGKKVIIIALLVALIIGILASAIYYITLDDAAYKEGNKANVPYTASRYVSSTRFTENGITFIRTNIDTGQEVEVSSMEMAEYLWEEMINNGSTIRNYLDSVEELEKLMNAELITQYPKLDNVGSNVLNGTIRFVRNDSDGNSIELKYMNKSFFDFYLSRNDTRLDNYYTLDENDNLLIAVDSSIKEDLIYNDPDVSITDYSNTITDQDRINGNIYSKTTHNYEVKTLNYKNVVSKYTMPFQYLWSLIVIGDDKGVGLDLAELVNNSEIVISIYDNITTTVDSSAYSYNREKKVDLSATATASTNAGNRTKTSSSIRNWPSPANAWRETDENGEISYLVSHVFTYKSNNPIIDVTKANVWIVDYSKGYKYQGNERIDIEENEKNLEDTAYVNDGANPRVSSSGNGSDLPYYDKISGTLDFLKNTLNNELSNELVEAGMVNGVTQYEPLEVYSTSITSCQASYYKHNTNIVEKNVRRVNSQKYVAEVPVNNPKVQKKTEEQIKNGTGPNNFVTILSDSKHVLAKNKICDECTSWLTELLEENPDTTNMVELTKYLLYKTIEVDKYGVSEYDFSQYEPSSFSSVSTGIYAGTIQEKVWFMLKDLGISDIAAAGAMGNIHYESGSFDPSKVEGGYNENNGGIGLCQWTNSKRGTTGRNTNLKSYAGAKGWQDEDSQVEFLRAELSGGGLGGLASNQLLDRRNYYGVSVAYGNGWKNATTIDDATKAFCYSFERPNADDARKSMSTRIGYAQKYYDEFAGREKSGGELSIDSSNEYLIGKFTSSVTGRTFTIFNQTKIPNWGNKCNRAAQSSVCSGYYSGNAIDIISMAASTCPSYANLYSNCGLKCRTGSTDLTPETIKGQIQNKGYIIPYLKGKDVNASGYSKYRT